MVSTQQRKRMAEYVVNRLAMSGMPNVTDVEKDCLRLQTDEKNVYIYLHATPEGTNQFTHKLHGLINRGDFVSNIFYKDGKNFFVLLDEDKKYAFARTTMKDYDFNEISRMIRLRDKEREVLRLQGQKRLVYYQPDNTNNGGRLREGLVSFALNPVQTSYSHKEFGSRGYDFIMADDGKTLLTRAISEDKKVLGDRLKLAFSKKSPHLPILEAALNPIQKRFMSPAYSSKEALKYFLAQTGTTLDDWGGSDEDIEQYINPQ